MDDIFSPAPAPAVPAALGVDDEGTIVTKLHPSDVLFGRGAPSCFYIGNLEYHELICPRKKAFMGTGRHCVKAGIAKEVYDIVTGRNGRFLRRVAVPGKAVKSRRSFKVTETFTIVSKDDALVKIKQALREFRSKKSAPPPKRRNHGVARPCDAPSHRAQSTSTNLSSPRPMSSEDDVGLASNPQPPLVSPESAVTTLATSMPLPNALTQSIMAPPIQPRWNGPSEHLAEQYHMLLASRNARTELLCQQMALLSHQVPQHWAPYSGMAANPLDAALSLASLGSTGHQLADSPPVLNPFVCGHYGNLPNPFL